jgi:hypothetical protein
MQCVQTSSSGTIAKPVAGGVSGMGNPHGKEGADSGPRPAPTQMKVIL